LQQLVARVYAVDDCFVDSLEKGRDYRQQQQGMASQEEALM
jgi:hypothetical protein